MSDRVLVDASVLDGIKMASEEAGIDINRRMQALGLNPETFLESEGFIDWNHFNELLESVAKEDGCRYFGLLVGKHQKAMGFGVLTQILKLSKNVGEALRKGQHYSQAYTQAAYWEIGIEGGFVFVSRKARYAQSEVFGQSNTLGMIQTVKMMKSLCGASWHPTSISFIHSETDADTRTLYEKYFGVPVLFDQEEEGLFFRERDLSIPLQTADENLLRVVEAHAEDLQRDHGSGQDFLSEVRVLIRKNLSENTCSLNHVAQIVNIHPKTLHRKLKDHGVTFKKILLEERVEVARYYLSKSNITLLQLSTLLGYSDASSFSKAFKRQCGCSPQAWRQSHGKDK